MSCVCSKIIRSKTPWDSTKVFKNPSGGHGSKGDFEGFAVKLCNCKEHTHPSGGKDEKCNSSTWRSVDHITY
jgi:hypothetical protein